MPDQSVSKLVSCGAEMYAWAEDLFPICRSITGPGVRETLNYFQNIVPEFQMSEVPSGTEVFDWTVPKEWRIRSARLTGPDGEVVCDFDDNNLHVVSYSTPVDETLSLEELQPHLHSRDYWPDAIPYVTSYYKETWGFCLPYDQHMALKPGNYHAQIDSELLDGSLTYADMIIPGESEEEILISSYCCHPSMANNELSGPIVTTAIARWLMSLDKRRYTYRIVIAPETIGSLAYMSRHLPEMKKNTVGGYILSCIGDDRAYSYLPTRWGDRNTDRVARHVFDTCVDSYTEYPFRTRGSDERQYCSPGADLPVSVVSRSKFTTYPEYHCSKDDLSVISPEGLQGGFNLVKNIIQVWENNSTFVRTTPGEPFLSKYGLYEELPFARGDQFYFIRDVAAYADGEHDLIELAELNNLSAVDCIDIVDKMLACGVVERG